MGDFFGGLLLLLFTGYLIKRKFFPSERDKREDVFDGSKTRGQWIISNIFWGVIYLVSIILCFYMMLGKWKNQHQ